MRVFATAGERETHTHRMLHVSVLLTQMAAEQRAATTRAENWLGSGLGPLKVKTRASGASHSTVESPEGKAVHTISASVGTEGPCLCSARLFTKNLF